MTGPLILIAAIVSPTTAPAPRALAEVMAFRPIGGATARASASVRIITGVRFGPGRSGDAPGGAVRLTRTVDAEGQLRPTKLLEFQ